MNQNFASKIILENLSHARETKQVSFTSFQMICFEHNLCVANVTEFKFLKLKIFEYMVTLVTDLYNDTYHMKFRTNTKAQTSAQIKVTVHKCVNGMRKKIEQKKLKRSFTENMHSGFEKCFTDHTTTELFL